MLRSSLVTATSLSVFASFVITACSSSSSSAPPTADASTPGDDGGATTDLDASTAADHEATESVNACVGIASAPTCEPAIDVATADEIFARIAALAESFDGSTSYDSGAKLVPTRDLHTTTAITLDVAAYRTAHPVCTGVDGGASQTGCLESVFTGEQRTTRKDIVAGAVRPLPAGVTCVENTTGGCAKIAIAAETIVRFTRASTPNGFGNYYPHFIRVTRGCAVGCDADELRCAASTTCITKESFCRFCEGKSLQACACRTECTVAAEGASCGYFVSDDVGGSGTCTAGTCTPH